MIEELIIKKVASIPLNLQEGVLYVSLENQVVGHICPCGCGSKVLIRIGKAGWKYTENKGKVTLFPSLGNWQLPCKSHYWITNGLIEWSYEWSEKQIIEGRQAEEEKRILYYDNIENKHNKQSLFKRFINFLLRK